MGQISFLCALSFVSNQSKLKKDSIKENISSTVQYRSSYISPPWCRPFYPSRIWTYVSHYISLDGKRWVFSGFFMIDRHVFSFDKGSMKYTDKRDQTRKFLFYFNKHCHGLYVLSYILITRCIMKSRHIFLKYNLKKHKWNNKDDCHLLMNYWVR